MTARDRGTGDHANRGRIAGRDPVGAALTRVTCELGSPVLRDPQRLRAGISDVLGPAARDERAAIEALCLAAEDDLGRAVVAGLATGPLSESMVSAISRRLVDQGISEALSLITIRRIGHALTAAQPEGFTAVPETAPKPAGAWTPSPPQAGPPQAGPPLAGPPLAGPPLAGPPGADNPVANPLRAPANPSIGPVPEVIPPLAQRYPPVGPPVTRPGTRHPRRRGHVIAAVVGALVVLAGGLSIVLASHLGAGGRTGSADSVSTRPVTSGTPSATGTALHQGSASSSTHSPTQVTVSDGVTTDSAKFQAESFSARRTPGVWSGSVCVDEGVGLPPCSYWFLATNFGPQGARIVSATVTNGPGRAWIADNRVNYEVTRNGPYVVVIDVSLRLGDYASSATLTLTMNCNTHFECGGDFSS